MFIVKLTGLPVVYDDKPRFDAAEALREIARRLEAGDLAGTIPGVGEFGFQKESL